MNVLLLAPHPFYQDRGTPIAIDLLLRVLSERGDHIDVLTYHEGLDVTYPGVTLHRIPAIPGVRGIRPGFSWKKLVCDGLMFGKLIRMLRSKTYHCIHAVEEGVFMALALTRYAKVPYVYDMDSCMSQQIVDKYPWCTPLFTGLRWAEGLAVRRALAVVPVCEALAAAITVYRPRKVLLLQDISLLQEGDPVPVEDLRSKLGLTGQIVMYVGNLESYQGIGLLLESFALAMHHTEWEFGADLVVIGGAKTDIQQYRQQAAALGLESRAHFIGPRPLEALSAYLAQADVLVSPRLQGSNTPMKLYSYLHSGKALIATCLPTHTQVLTPEVALLAQATPEAFAKALLTVMVDGDLRFRLGRAGHQLVKDQYSYPAFKAKVDGLYDWLDEEIGLIKRDPSDKQLVPTS